MGGQQRRELHVQGRTPESVLESCEIVHLHGDDAVDADGLEDLRDIARGDRVVGLGASILASVAEIRGHRGDGVGSGILEGAAEEEKSAQFVVSALHVIAVQGMDDEDVVAPYALERSRLVLAVLEGALLVRRQRHLESGGDLFREGAASFQREDSGGAMLHVFLRRD